MKYESWKKKFEIQFLILREHKITMRRVNSTNYHRDGWNVLVGNGCMRARIMMDSQSMHTTNTIDEEEMNKGGGEKAGKNRDEIE